MKKIFFIFFLVLTLCLHACASSDTKNTNPAKQTYTTQELKLKQNDILRTLRQLKHVPIVGIGINETEGYVELSIYRDEIRNFESLVALWKLQKKYGEVLKIEYMNSNVHMDATSNTSSNSPSKTITLWGIAAIALFGFYFIQRKKHLNELATNTNQTLDFSPSYTQEQIRQMIKYSSVSLPETVDKKILESIEKARVSHL